ncbi:MAG: hypothetical protein PHT83_01580 [Bacilli bacterium]|nr:hypothetical protein [Bacilli bacterium]
MSFLNSLKLIWIFYRKIYFIYLLILIFIFSSIFKVIPDEYLFDVSMHAFFSITAIFTLIIAFIQAKKIFCLSSFKVARTNYWINNLILSFLNSIFHLLIFLVFVFKFNFDFSFVVITCLYYIVGFLTINTISFLVCYERTNIILLISMAVLLIIYVNLLYILYSGDNMNYIHTLILFFGTPLIAFINLFSLKYIDIC